MEGREMFSSAKMKPGIWLGLVILVFSIAGAGESKSETGSGESPLFSLNTAWATGVTNSAGVPRADRLGGCYPNPFNPLTMISFELARATTVEMRVYDLQGRLVKVLLENESLAAGTHEKAWDGRDNQGNGVAAGVYLYRLVTDTYSGSRRMTLVK